MSTPAGWRDGLPGYLAADYSPEQREELAAAFAEGKPDYLTASDLVPLPVDELDTAPEEKRCRLGRAHEEHIWGLSGAERYCPGSPTSVPVVDFDVEPRDVAQLPAETLGDLYAAAQQAAGALDAVSRLIVGPVVNARETAAQLKEVQLRLEHALTAATDRTETP